MTLAWTTAARQLNPHETFLAFYCPTDYEDPFWTTPNVPASVKVAENDWMTSDSYELDDQIWAGLFDAPITGYDIPSTKRALGGWLTREDARSRLALHLNKHGRTLHVLLGGPLAQIRAGNYVAPTFLIHPRDDDLIPWQQAERTWQRLRDWKTVDAELRLVENVPHGPFRLDILLPNADYILDC